MLAFDESLVWWAADGPSIDVRLRRHARLTSGVTARRSMRGGRVAVPGAPPGTGGGRVGLFVVRAVAEAQDGRAWATVEDDMTLHLNLPVS